MSSPQPDRLDDGIDAAWIWDRIARGVIFVGGISAIVFVVAIFAFVAREGLGFIFQDLDLGFFFTSPEWRPDQEPKAEFGGLGPDRRHRERHRARHAHRRPLLHRRGHLHR